MNCLDARREFAGFWRRSLSEEDRGALLTHLWSCETCDHSFRVFSLTAPVLHGAPPSARIQRVRAEPNPPAPVASASSGWERRRTFVAAFVMGAAAAVALYFSGSRPVTLEDAINGAGPAAIAATAQDNNDSLFGGDDFGRDVTPGQSKPASGEDHGLAS